METPSEQRVLVKEMSWDPITRIVGSLGIHTEIDFANQEVLKCYSTSMVFRGFDIFMKGIDPRDAHFITSRICGICGDNHCTTSCLNQNMLLPSFTGSTTFDLRIPCSYDLEVAATKYFYSLPGGHVPLTLVFSGSIFYKGDAGRLQVVQIPWDLSARFRLPLKVWRETIDHHYAASSWIRLHTDTLDRLRQRVVDRGLPSFDHAAVDLTEDTAILTALANDIGPHALFQRQLIAHGRRGDAALALSTSGGSVNIVEALVEARRRGLATIALVGYGGGRILAERLADHVVVTPSEHIPRIQEAQATAYHLLRTLVEQPG